MYFSDIQHNEITNVEEYPNRLRKALRTRDRGAQRSAHGRQSAVERRPARGFTGPPRSGGSAPSQARYGTQLRGVRTGRRSEAPHPPPACSAEPSSDMRAEPALGSYLARALPMGPADAAAPPAPPAAPPAACALNTGRLRWGGSRFFRSSTDRTRTTRWWMAASTE